MYSLQTVFLVIIIIIINVIAAVIISSGVTLIIMVVLYSLVTLVIIVCSYNYYKSLRKLVVFHLKIKLSRTSWFSGPNIEEVGLIFIFIFNKS